MHEEPTPPEEIPAIPRGRLWASLLLPPGITALLTLILANAFTTEYGSAALGGLPFGGIAIIVCLFPFLDAIQVRYQGRSVALLGSGFFVGQLVMCFAAWFGACVVFVSLT